MLSLFITVIACLGFLIIYVIKPIYGIAFLTAIRPFLLSPQMSFGIYSISAEGFYTLMIIIFALFYYLQYGRKIYQNTSFFPFLLFIIWGIITFSVATDYINFSKKLFRLIGYLFLYILVANECRNQKSFVILLISFMIAILFTLVPAIYAFILNPEIYISITENIPLSVVMSKNNFGFFLCYMMFFLYYIANSNRYKMLRFFSILLLPILSLAFILCYTRAAWVSLICASSILLLFKETRRKIIIPFFLVILVGIMFSYKIYHGLYEDVTTTREVGFSSWEFRTRLAWPASIKTFKARPIMGFGLGNDRVALNKVANWDNTSHNDYLLLLVETGAIGFILYLNLLISIFLRTYKGIKTIKDEDKRFFCIVALLIFSSFMVGSFAEHLLQTPGATGYVITTMGMAHGVIRSWGGKVFEKS
ncbi:MAG: O-antigen ligase family protein [Deltaproteobacteria bacterium]|uniref:O-antigen ligase family protein n=1 Tax=Desulfobacula sp. TaxID=2593537 RepID=UPI0019B51624|nr:O-antigen ligase family protein [Candidatus Desulfobacula maris]MBL6995852.1 O-antigen ligase family protein [Desulfobacula sp.]